MIERRASISSIKAPESIRSAYVHIPFCAHKCGYCDFASVAGEDDRMAEYLDALDEEIAVSLPEAPTLDTLFVGGGTPTYLPEPLLERAMSMLRRNFRLTPNAEFTVESNPNTLTAGKVDRLADAGVNRISLGAQSFKPALLAVLERDHDPAGVERAVAMVAKRIERYSIDLIFGVPGQSVDDWLDDLDRAVALGSTHLSTYGLTFEKGTRLFRQRLEGVVSSIDESIERTMFERSIDRLADKGFVHYEISNFARRPSAEPTGRPAGEAEVDRCRHNLVYWANEPYFGFGAGAAGFVEGKRSLNTRNLDTYLARLAEGRSPIVSIESLVGESAARETAYVNLRRLEIGVNRPLFRAKTGFDVDDLFAEPIRRHVALGLLRDDGQSIRLTREGLMVADSVIADFLA
jgi:oxygen-independent coproporphyrinogen-3 oxidase